MWSEVGRPEGEEHNLEKPWTILENITNTAEERENAFYFHL